MFRSRSFEKKYGPLRPVRETARFATFEGRLDGRRVFIKQAKDEHMCERLLAEASGYLSLYELDPLGKLYRTPRVLVLTSEYIVSEWVNGQTMEVDFERNAEEAMSTHLPYLLKLYEFFDQSSRGRRGVTRFNRPGHERQVQETIETLLERHAAYHIDSRLLREVDAYIRAVLPQTETRYTNGDLQPGNIFIQENNPPVLVDCETCSWLWPRHYNIVNFVVNYGLRYPVCIPIFRRLLHQYNEAVNVNLDTSLDAFNISAAVRCLQIVIEQGATQAGSENTFRITYVEEMLRRIVQGKIFIDGSTD